MLTHAQLLSYFTSISGNHTISGQFIELKDLSTIQAVEQSTGKWLGMIGGDYWYFGAPMSATPTYPFNTNAISYWNAGGLVTLTLSMPNPDTGNGSTDTTMDWTALLTSGTPTNNNLYILFSQILLGLQALQTAGVIVVLRPFHENNGNWFWWGTGTSAQFQQLWKLFHDYLTVTNKLTNIIWLYGVNTNTGSLTANYPGDSYVDITGQDGYTSNMSDLVSSYNTLLTLNKPVCLCEFGPGSPSQGDPTFDETVLINAIKTTMPKTVFWQQWWDGNGNLPGWGMAECTNVKAALTDPWVFNRGDINLSNANNMVFLTDSKRLANIGVTNPGLVILVNKQATVTNVTIGDQNYFAYMF